MTVAPSSDHLHTKKPDNENKLETKTFTKSWGGMAPVDGIGSVGPLKALYTSTLHQLREVNEDTCLTHVLQERQEEGSDVNHVSLDRESGRCSAAALAAFTSTPRFSISGAAMQATWP